MSLTRLFDCSSFILLQIRYLKAVGNLYNQRKEKQEQNQLTKRVSRNHKHLTYSHVTHNKAFFFSLKKRVSQNSQGMKTNLQVLVDIMSINTM